MGIVLRPYQADLEFRTHEAWRLGAKTVLVRLGTGGGKTRIFGSVIQKHQGASCLVVHRTELVGQIAMTLAELGIRHDIFAATETRRAIARQQVDTFGTCYYQPGARCVVASVQTLSRMKDIGTWAAQVTLGVIDECFPAGTLVDGRPIETLRPGDTVTAFDEHTGLFEPRKIVRTFRNAAPKHMVRVSLSTHHVLDATKGHPFWTRRGWIEAENLTVRDEVLVYDGMYDVRKLGRSEPSPSGGLGKNRPSVLFARLFARLLPQGELRNDVTNEPGSRVGSHDPKQPDGARRGAAAHARYNARSRAPAGTTGRQRKAADRRRNAVTGHTVRAWLFESVRRTYENAAYVWLSHGVQTGRGECSVATRDRGGWTISRNASPSRAGPEERGVSNWHRLDRVEIYEREDSGRTGRSVGDDHVYNIEVEGLHTYIANGVTVHNCHHAVQGNQWGNAFEIFTHPRMRWLFPTATPIRADGKGLGRLQSDGSPGDGFADVMIEGPPERWLIAEGYLTDYRVVCPPSDLQIAGLPGASGDWSPAQLKAAARASHITGDLPKSYMEFTPHLLGISFCTDVETAIETCEAYKALGARAETITGDTHPAVRRDIFRRFERQLPIPPEQREITQLCVVDIVSEGTDLPVCQVGSFGRPSESLGLVRQQMGRIFRPVYAPGPDLATTAGRLEAIALSDKPHAWLIDHVRHFVKPNIGPPDRPRVWTLDRRDKRGKAAADDAIPLRVCVECYQPYERFRRACPFCGHEPVPTSRSAPAHVDGDLALLDEATLAALRGAVIDVTPTGLGDKAREWAAAGLPQYMTATNGRAYNRKVDAQVALRAAMAQWGGVQLAAGRTDVEMQRLFFLRYGVDVLSARGLAATEANALYERVLTDVSVPVR